MVKTLQSSIVSHESLYAGGLLPVNRVFPSITEATKRAATVRERLVCSCPQYCAGPLADARGSFSRMVGHTLHDLRWGAPAPTGTTDQYVWVFLIPGNAPPAHHIGGWGGSEGHRLPPMYFPNGGSTLRSVAKPGEIVWSRIFIERGRLKMDLGRAGVGVMKG